MQWGKTAESPQEPDMDDILKDVRRFLSERRPRRRPAEYRVRLVQKPAVPSARHNYRWDLSLYLRADSLDDARKKVEQNHPPEEYSILDIRQIR